MEKIHISTIINAPKKRVWETMLQDSTYREWTSAFNPGSYYKGNFDEGSKILFLGPNPDGTGESGMVSRIKESRPYDFISIEHLGIVKDGVEDTTSEATKDWAGAFENYTFNDSDGGTELVIDMDITPSEKEFMENAWKKGLEILKKLAEEKTD